MTNNLKSDARKLPLSSINSVKWSKPYAGQTKPIERAFRDLCQSLSDTPQKSPDEDR